MFNFIVTLSALALISSASEQLTYKLKHGPRSPATTNAQLYSRDLIQLPFQSAYENFYTIDVQIGMPLDSPEKQIKSMIIDTGSTLFMFGGEYLRQKHSSLVANYKNVKIARVGVFPKVTSYKDDMIFSNATLRNVIINHVETSIEDPIGGPGIMGIGPSCGAARQLEEYASINTPVDALFFEEKYIKKHITSLLFLPTSSVFSTSESNGIITFGGIDESIPTGNISYYPLYRTRKGLDVNRMFYGKAHYALEVAQFRCQFLTKGGWLDSKPMVYKEVALTAKQAKPLAGPFLSMSQFIHLPVEVLQKYLSALPGAQTQHIEEYNQAVIVLNQTHIDKLGNFTIVIGKDNYVLTPAAQVLPPEFAAKHYGIQLPSYVSVFSNIPKDMYYDFALGLPFMERYMTVFNQHTDTFGLATTPYTFENTLDPNRLRYSDLIDEASEASDLNVRRRAVNIL